MNELDFPTFPIIQPEEEAEAASACSAGYVSTEELRCLNAMRDLRAQALEVRDRLATAEVTERTDLEERLEVLRARWKDLDAQRRLAERRKMASWGHISWDEVNAER